MDEQAAVTAHDLVVDRGGTPPAGHSLDLDVPRGVVIGLLGPSGCGKTTLMRAIVGVQIVAGGTVTCWANRPARPACAAASAT